MPRFNLGFLALATLRSLGLIPDDWVAPLARIAGFLTIVSMAALGRGVDVRVLERFRFELNRLAGVHRGT
ncbi:Conserved hypothetical protein 698 [Methylobacterium sp. 275MFSha3.1]|nr:Conserved hypothetical protein 698 [Methylobacterium sp. 275MFSha3.1]